MTPAQRKLHTWMAFTIGTTEAEARAAFVKKHGREPQWVGAGLNQVMAGPLPPRDASCFQNGNNCVGRRQMELF